MLVLLLLLLLLLPAPLVQAPVGQECEGRGDHAEWPDVAAERAGLYMAWRGLRTKKTQKVYRVFIIMDSQVSQGSRRLDGLARSLYSYTKYLTCWLLLS